MADFFLDDDNELADDDKLLLQFGLSQPKQQTPFAPIASPLSQFVAPPTTPLAPLEVEEVKPQAPKKPLEIEQINGLEVDKLNDRNTSQGLSKEKIEKFLGRTPSPSSVNHSSIGDALSTLLGNSREETLAALNNQNSQQAIALLGRAGQQAGAALVPLSNVKPDDQAFKAAQEMANQPVKNLSAMRTMDTQALQQEELKRKLQDELSKSSPDSPIAQYASKLTKALSKQTGLTDEMGNPLEVPEGLSYADQEKIQGLLSKIYSAKTTAEAKKAQTDLYTELRKGNQILRGTQMYEQATKPFTQSLNSANNLEGLLHKIKAGQIPSAKNVANLIAAETATLFTGLRQTAYGDREHMQIDALERTWSEWISKIKSSPQDTIPKAYLPQLQKEVDLLKEKTVFALQIASKRLKAGVQDLPHVANSIDRQYRTEMEQRGFDPDTRKVMKRSFDPKTEAAIDAVFEDNPNKFKTRDDAVQYLLDKGLL